MKVKSETDQPTPKALKHPKPTSIREIAIKFSTEEQCLQYVEKMRWPDGIVRCPTCGDSNVKAFTAISIKNVAPGSIFA